MVMPAALSISVSASTNGIPSRPASRRPTDDLPGTHHADQHDGAAAERADDRGLQPVFRRFLNGTVGHARVPNQRYGSIYQ